MGSKYLNVVIQDDTGKEIVNAIRALAGIEPLEINRKDVDRSLLDTTGKLIAEAISGISAGCSGGDVSGELDSIRERLDAIEQAQMAHYVFKGSVETVDDLPDGANVGDVYDVKASGMNFAWTGEEWDALGGPIYEPYVESDIDKLFP